MSMIKKAFIAAVVLVASSPAFVSAQDFFFSFDEFSRVPTASVASGTATGSVFIFSDENLDFNQLDLDFTNNNSTVVSFTGATTFNSDRADGTDRFTAFAAEDPNVPGGPITATDGRLFAVTIPLRPGPLADPANRPGVNDPDFRAGANGFLLARVDYDIIGDGIANFDFILGDLGVVDDGVGPVDVDFTGGQGTLTVGVVPEPSSAVLLILGAARVVARRRRS